MRTKVCYAKMPTMPRRQLASTSFSQLKLALAVVFNNSWSNNNNKRNTRLLGAVKSTTHKHTHTVPTKSMRPLSTLVALSFSLRRCEVYCVVCALVLLAGVQTKLTRRKLDKLHANMAAELTSWQAEGQQKHCAGVDGPTTLTSWKPQKLIMKIFTLRLSFWLLVTLLS